MAHCSQLPLINEAFVAKHLSIAELVPCLERMFVSFSDKENDDISQPLRSTVEIKRHGGRLLCMPAYNGSLDSLSVKLLSVNPTNAGRNLPTIYSLMVLFDAKTGTPTALLEAEEVTVLRTCAATVVATKHLMNPAARILAIIGSGLQAEGHIHAFRGVLKNFTEIRVCGRSKERREALASRTGTVACATVEEAVKDADVVVTVTLSTVPVVEKSWLKADALVNVVGGNSPRSREVSDELMQTSQLIADSKEAAVAEAGDFVATGMKAEGEIGDVIAGKVKPDFNRIRLFKSQGMAAEDAVAAHLVYKKYIATLAQDNAQ